MVSGLVFQIKKYYSALKMKKRLIIILFFTALILPVNVLAALPNTVTALGENVKAIFWTVFLVFVVVCFIIAGILFMTARGDPQKLLLARAAVIWGVVGVVVGLLSTSVLPILFSWL